MFDGYFFEGAVFMNKYSGNTFEKRRNFFFCQITMGKQKMESDFFSVLSKLLRAEPHSPVQKFFFSSLDTCNFFSFDTVNILIFF